MAQTSRISKNNTKIWTDDIGITRVRLHDTTVVAFDEKIIVLDSGGWETITTRTRMNQASNQFDLGIRVFQEKHIWYVSILHPQLGFVGNNHKFKDRMIIDRKTGKVDYKLSK